MRRLFRSLGVSCSCFLMTICRWERSPITTALPAFWPVLCFRVLSRFAIFQCGEICFPKQLAGGEGSCFVVLRVDGVHTQHHKTCVFPTGEVSRQVASFEKPWRFRTAGLRS